MENIVTRRASLTVEASLVVWLCVISLSSFLLLFPVLKKQVVMCEAMYVCGRDTVKSCIVTELPFEESLLAYQYLLWNKWTSASAVFTTEKAEHGYYLRGETSQSLFVPGLSRLKTSQTVYICPFDGYDPLSDEGGEDTYVYITKYGTVYHRSKTCYHLLISIKEVAFQSLSSLRNKDGAIYYPCKTCNSQGISDGIVYITPEGNRYHLSRECSALLRYIEAKPLSQVEGSYRPCADCGGM